MSKTWVRLQEVGEKEGRPDSRWARLLIFATVASSKTVKGELGAARRFLYVLLLDLKNLRAFWGLKTLLTVPFFECMKNGGRWHVDFEIFPDSV